MGLTPRQVQILENKLATVEHEGQNLHKAVEQCLFKVKSWGNALIESQETQDKSFLQIRLDLEKAIDYLAEKAEEIIKGNLRENVTQEDAETTTTSVAPSLPTSSALQSEYAVKTMSELQSEINKLKDELKTKAKLKTVNNKMKTIEERMIKAEDKLENLVREKDENMETLKKRLQEGERRLLDINRLQEELNKSEMERTMMTQTIETLKNGLQEAESRSEGIEILKEKLFKSESERNQTREDINKLKTDIVTLRENRIQQIEANVDKVKQRLRQSEEDERETAMMVQNSLMLLEDKTEVNNQQSKHKKMTDTVSSVGSISNFADESTEFYEAFEIFDEGLWQNEQQKKRDCTKNPGHEGFIDISDLRLEHLPECYRDNLVLDYIKTRADLVVRLKVKHVSPDRPDNFLTDKGGQHMSNLGSGWVWCVDRQSAKDEYDHCRCRTCRKSAKPRRECAKIWVMTAMNVVYDSEEATHTICELFYDSEEVRGKCLKLEGVELVYNDRKDEWCWMKCLTHDEDLLEKLEVMLARKSNIAKELNSKYQAINSDDNVAFVVSHPHGCKKQISWGKVTRVDTVEPYKIYYSAPTCPGSNGGLVWLPGQGQLELSMSYVSIHNGLSKEGNNSFSAGQLLHW